LPKTPEQRVVLDTSALVSRLLLPGSVPAQAVGRAARDARLLVSRATLTALAEVLSRPKFDRYATISDRQQFLRLLCGIAEMIPVIRRVRACRDPRDDMFLEVALNGDASAIVTGDRDLLALDPFRGIPILTPAQYLAR
jgi:putative PIN family toxin of toxin-antitoxin system